MTDRITTGVPELDQVLEGGFPAGRCHEVWAFTPPYDRRGVMPDRRAVAYWQWQSILASYVRMLRIPMRTA